MLSLFIALPAVAGPALAQDFPAPRSERPYRGLFRSGVDDAAHVLTATASAGGGYDEVLLRGVDSTADSLQRLSGGYSMVSGGLSYGLTLRPSAPDRGEAMVMPTGTGSTPTPAASASAPRAAWK